MFQKRLRVLDVGANEIEHLENVAHLHELEEFWINNNKLESLEELTQLTDATKLQTIYLEGNPLASDPSYEAEVLRILPPSLNQLNAEPIHRENADE